MSRQPIMLFFFAFALAVSVVLPVPSSAAPAQQREPISMELKDAPAADVFDAFASMTESTADLEEAVQGTVTIQLDRVSWKTALDAVCETLSCRWTLVEDISPHRLEIRALPSRVREGASLDTRIQISLLDADAKSVLNSFAEISGRKLIAPDGLEGLVSIELEGVRARTALTAVCESLGYQWEDEDGTLVVRRVVGQPAEDADNGLSQAPPVVDYGAISLPEWLEKPLSVDLKDAASASVFKSFAKILGLRLDLAADVSGAITVHLEEQPIAKTLDAVCQQLQCRWEIRKSADGQGILAVW